MVAGGMAGGRPGPFLALPLRRRKRSSTGQMSASAGQRKALVALVGACHVWMGSGFSGGMLRHIGGWSWGHQIACRRSVFYPLGHRDEEALERGIHSRTIVGQQQTPAPASAEAAADHYEELGIERGADAWAVKKAFRALSKKLHPDVADDNGEKTKARFLRVVAAYSTLSDPIRRSKYDAKLGLTNVKGVVSEMFSFNGDATTPSWGSATEMWGGSKSQRHVCSRACDCGMDPFGRDAFQYQPPAGEPASWRAGAGGVGDVELSSTFQELLGLKDRAASHASRRTFKQQKLITCPSCGFLTEEGRAQCGACGQATGALPGAQRGSRVTPVFTMHPGSNREEPNVIGLGDDMIHELVHKNHFSPAHTRRPPPAAADDASVNMFEVDTGGFRASATFQELLALRDCAAQKVARARKKLFTCSACGFLTEDGVQCSACGSGRAPPLTRQKRGVTLVFTMHGGKGELGGGTAMGDDEMHSLVHKNHVLPQRPPAPAAAAPEAYALGDFFTGGGDAVSGGFGVGSVQFAQQRPSPLEEKRVSVCGNCGCYTSFTCGKCGACGSQWFRSESPSQAKFSPGPGQGQEKSGFATLRELNTYLEGGGTPEKTEVEWEGVLSDELARAAEERQAMVSGDRRDAMNRWKVLERQISPWLGTSVDTIGAPDVREVAPDIVGAETAADAWRTWRDVMLEEGERQVVYGTYGPKGTGGQEDEEVEGFLPRSVREMMGEGVGAKRLEIEASMAAVEAQIEDLSFFISHMSAYSDRVREEAHRAEVLVQELELLARQSDAMLRGATRCMKCGCDSLDDQRCDACGTPMEALSDQRGSSHVGVYTMHGGTRLGDDDRHNLVHKNHFDLPGLTAMVGSEMGLEWMVQGSFGLVRDAAGALPGQRIHKDNCESCVELEQMLAKGKSRSMSKKEYEMYLKMGGEALRKRRESQKLDLVVTRKREVLSSLQFQLDEMLEGVREIERLFGDMLTIGADGLGPGCGILYDDEMEDHLSGELLG